MRTEEKHRPRAGGQTLRLRSRVRGCVYTRQIPDAGRSFPGGRTLRGWGRSLPPACFPSFLLTLSFSERRLSCPPPARSRPHTSPVPNQRGLPRKQARVRRRELRLQWRSHLLRLRWCPARNAPGTAVRCLYSARRRQGHILFMEQQRHLSSKEGHTGSDLSPPILPRKKSYLPLPHSFSFPNREG